MLQCKDEPLVQKGIAYLKANDMVISNIIDAVGSFELHPRLPLFNGLIRTIISQQLGEPAAWALYKRFLRLYPNQRPSAALVNETPAADITNQGISRAKAILIKELAFDISSKKLDLRALAYRENEEVIASLTSYTGIGEWTANIFLMFCLGRIDVLPINDLALRRGISESYKIAPDDMVAISRITARWKPFRTVGSWYVWKSLGIGSI